MTLPSSIPRWLLLAAVIALLGLGLVTYGSDTSALGGSEEANGVVAGEVASSFYARLAQLESDLTDAADGSADRVEYALLLHDAHRHAEAAGELERYVASRPDDREAWLHLANVYGAIEDWDAADRVSRRLLDHFPDDASGVYNLGAIAANRGRSDEARTWWTLLAGRQDDAALALQAQISLARLDAMGSGTANAVADRARSQLPPGHPPVGARPSYLPARPLRTSN